jgi:hypothetical protein
LRRWKSRLTFSGDRELMLTGWRGRDRNTTFFHKWCSERRKNKIGRLRKEDGGWVEEEVEKREFISNHFVQLFRVGDLGTHNNSSRMCPQKSPRR